MSHVSWRAATSSDRRAFESFKCTPPRPKAPNGRTLAHAAEWEWEVQSWIRNDARKECSGSLDERVLVADGVEPSCLAAVAAHARCDATYAAWAREQVLWEGPVRILRAVAVDLRHQGKGLGREAMERALDDIVDREAEESTLVLALIHERNERSQRMAGSLDFELAPFPCEGAPGMHFWFADV